MNNRLTIDGNVFYADFEDQQREDVLSGDASVIRNADATHSYGAEITANWLPRRSLDVFGSLGLLETEIDDFTGSEDLEGNAFARAPSVTSALGATYQFARGLSVGVDGQYVGSYDSEDDNAPAGEVDSFVLFNARASYDFSKHYRLFAFATNLFDKDYELLIYPASPGFPTQAQLVDPREFGVGLEVSF